jgi:hypothetical protein
MCFLYKRREFITLLGGARSRRGHKSQAAPVALVFSEQRLRMKRNSMPSEAACVRSPHLPDADRPSHATLTARPETSQVPMRSLCT